MVGVPKTIDNDIMLMDKTFGFDTAVEAAQKAINSAYIEVIDKKKKARKKYFCTAIHQQTFISLVYLYSHVWLFVFNQAQSAFHGIGLVKLMGRTSGFIAMHASLSSGQIDICLIPEVVTSSSFSLFNHG